MFKTHYFNVDTKLLKTDGYGSKIYEFVLKDPPLEPGWRIVGRNVSAEDGEHIWAMIDIQGRLFRWLEDEDGPEWAYRLILLKDKAKSSNDTRF